MPPADATPMLPLPPASRRFADFRSDACFSPFSALRISAISSLSPPLSPRFSHTLRLSLMPQSCHAAPAFRHASQPPADDLRAISPLMPLPPAFRRCAIDIFSQLNMPPHFQPFAASLLIAQAATPDSSPIYAIDRRHDPITFAFRHYCIFNSI